MDIGPFTIRINNRKILNGALTRLGLHDRVAPVLRALDKIDKIGPGAVADELAEAEVYRRRGAGPAGPDRLRAGVE